MRRNRTRTMCFITIVCGLASVALAQDPGACSGFSPAGTWGYNHTGTIIFPTGAAPVAIVGIITADANGHFSGTQTSSVGGQISKNTLEGTLTMNSDCTGTLTGRVYDPSGNLLRTVVWDAVYVDQAREAFEIATSLTAANGVSLPAILMGEAKRVKPGRGNGQ